MRRYLKFLSPLELLGVYTCRLSSVIIGLFCFCLVLNLLFEPIFIKLAPVYFIISPVYSFLGCLGLNAICRQAREEGKIPAVDKKKLRSVRFNILTAFPLNLCWGVFYLMLYPDWWIIIGDVGRLSVALFYLILPGLAPHLLEVYYHIPWSEEVEAKRLLN